jgi:predicted nicotinamide N-methyase
MPDPSAPGSAVHRIIEPQLSACLQRVLPSACAEAVALPDMPEIRLWLLNADFSNASLTRDEMQAVLNYPAYWAFCWASGQVLARWLLDNPQQVRGRTVLDFGCGSGVAAIAAARAGAARVLACDLDPDAVLATRINAGLNGVELTIADDFDHIDDDIDLILVADVLYDRANLAWLPRFLQRAPRVLVADSRIRDFSEPGYRAIGQQRSSTWPDLDEFDEFRSVNLYLGERAAQ